MVKKTHIKVFIIVNILIIILLSSCIDSNIQKFSLRKLSYSSTSPNGRYILNVYTRGEDMDDDAAVLVEVKDRKKHSKKNIFWQANTSWAYIVWKSNYKVCINGVLVDIRKDSYDYREHKEGKSFYQKKENNNLYLAIHSYNTSERKIKKMLKEEKVDVNYSDQDGNTLLMLAAYNGRVQTYDELLKYGADSAKTNNEGQGVLEFVIRSNQDESDILRFLEKERNEGIVLTENTWDVAYQPWKYSWREAACNYKILRWITNQMKQKDFVEKKIAKKDKIFFNAAYGIKKKATKEEVELQDQDGNSLLMVSAGYGNWKLAKNILEKGGNIKHKNRFGKDCLTYCIFKRQWKSVENLLKRGVENTDALLETSENGSIRGADLVLKYLNLMDDWHLKQAIMNALDLGHEKYAYHLFLKMRNKEYRGNSETVKERAEEVGANKFLKWISMDSK